MPLDNLFSELPKDLSSEVFSTLAQGNNLRIERIVSLGHCSPETEWYDQDDNEWVIVLQGKANILFQDSGEIHSLLPGDYLNITAHQKHRVTWTDPDNATIWLAIHYQ